MNRSLPATMFFVLALTLPVAAQERTKLQEGARNFFEGLIHVKLVDGHLEVRQSGTDEAVRARFEKVNEYFKSAGLNSYGRSGNSFNGTGTNASVSIQFGGSKEGFSYRAAGARESFDVRQVKGGMLTLIGVVPDVGTIIFTQKTDTCSLMVDDGKEFQTFREPSYDLLAQKHPAAVAKYILGPIERCMCEAPLTSWSPEVVAITLGLRPPAALEVTALEALIVQLDDESMEVREKAFSALKEKSDASVGVMNFLAEQAQASSSTDVKSNLAKVLLANPRRDEAYRHVVGKEIYRDLPHLESLLRSGAPAGDQLKSVTGKSFDTPDAWSAWIKENAGRIEWDAKRRVYLEKGR